MPTAEEQVVAAFDGAPAAPAPLTWGQRALWIAMRRRGPEQSTINMRRTVPLPDRVPDDVDGVVKALGALIGRHSSLRTRIREVDGEPRQEVAARGELPVLVVHDGGTEDCVATARAVGRRLAATPFDHAEEWPQRVALLLAGDRVRQVAFVFSHTTVDLRAAEMVVDDLWRLLQCGSIEAPAGPQSVDVARREQDADRHRSERATTYWVRSFGRLPQETLPRVGPPLAPRFQRWILSSPAADTAVRLAARRAGVSGTTVLLAATAAVISAWSDTAVCGIHAMCDNRSLTGYREAIAKLNQLALVTVDLTDRPSFGTLLPRVWRAALEAYRHAHYDPADLERGYRAAGFPYATGVSPHCYFNDSRRAPDTDLAGHATGEAEVRAAMARSTFFPAEALDHFTWRMRVQVLDLPTGLGIALTGDTGYLPPPAAERFLRDIERLVVAAAFGDPPWPWR